MVNKIKVFCVWVLLLVCGFQSGFIFKCWFDYKHGPVPMVTASEVTNAMNAYEERQEAGK